MASTGSTEGYNADNFHAQGSTRIEIGGHVKRYANSFDEWLATTYTVDGTTVPVGHFSVLRSSTGVTWNLSAAKQGAWTRLCILDATSSGLHTLACTSDYTLIAGGAAGVSATIANPGLISVYCPSTTTYVVSGVVVGSSDVVGGGST